MGYSYSVFVFICILLHFFEYSCVFSIHKKIMNTSRPIRIVFKYFFKSPVFMNIFEYILNTCHLSQKS